MSGTPLLKIEVLEASIDETEILKGIDLEILPGEVHAVMGRNGSVKSTTAHVLMGHPDYEVTNGNVKLYLEAENACGVFSFLDLT